VSEKDEKKFNMKVESEKLGDMKTKFRGLTRERVLGRLDTWLEYYSKVEIEEDFEKRFDEALSFDGSNDYVNPTPEHSHDWSPDGESFIRAGQRCRRYTCYCGAVKEVELDCGVHSRP